MKHAIFLIAILISTVSHAGKRIEICEEGDVVPDKGWVYKQVPCPVDREEQAKEKACGKDYGELRIGMTLKRFEQCNEALSFETEAVTKAGTVEIYHSTFYWIHARGGRIVAYSRRTY